MPEPFRVNTYQYRWQEAPDIAVLSNGDFIIVYDSYISESDPDFRVTAVLAQRFDASGAPIGGEQVISGVQDTTSESPSITALSDGGYAIAWTYDDFGPILSTDERVFVRAFNADGTPRTGFIEVDPTSRPGDPDHSSPLVTANANGGFTVSFFAQETSDNLYRQQFDATGGRIGGLERVNVNEDQFDQEVPRGALLSNGTTITIWNSEGSFPRDNRISSNEIRGTITDENGDVLRADFHLAINYGAAGSLFNSSGRGYDVAALRNGGFVVINKNYDFELGLDTEDTSYYTVMRFFDANGQQTGGPVIVDASDDLPGDARVTQLESGEIIAIWDQEDDTGGFVGDTIYGRVFSQNGAPLTGRFDVGADVPTFFDQEAPELVAMPGGGWIVTFMSEYIDSDREGIAARIFGRGTAEDDALTVTYGSVMSGFGGNDRLEGNALDNALYGGDGSDTLVGWGGDDTIYGGAENDVLRGNAGRNELWGGTGNDSLFGGAVADALWGNGGNDRLVGGAGADTMGGGDGNDLLVGGNGNDLAYGGAGGDRLYGQSGNDQLWAMGGNDRIIADIGNDTIGGGGGADVASGGGGSDLIFGGGQNDTLDGGAGADTLFGGAGNDRLVGGDGNDRLSGGAGADLLIGGAGADVFVFELRAEINPADRIADFGPGDQIALGAWAFAAAGPVGALASSAFHILGQGALDASDRILYNETTGRLFYDADGSGAGAAHLIATLVGAPELGAGDIVIF